MASTSEYPLLDRRTLAEEERAKDFATFRMAGRRRFWSTIFVAGILIGGTWFGFRAIPWQVSAGLFTLALTANWVLTKVATSERTYRWWMRYALAVFDTMLISAVVLAIGSPVLIIAYILAIVPYSFDRGISLGYVTAIASTLGYLAAHWGFRQLNPAEAPPFSQVLIGCALLLLVSQQVIRMPSKLIRRLRRTRERMIAVEQGDLHARAHARHHDELGFLERSFNRMLDELAHLIQTVQQEADDLAAVAVQVHGATRMLETRAVDVADGARELSDRLGEQRRTAESGARSSRQARDTADTTRLQAESSAGEARGLETAAMASRAAIERAANALVQLGEGVEQSAATVQRLDPASERVGEFVATVSRIARQTNMLALNAAIEASRAGEHGAGFAVVADEIRALAIESAQAAKVVAATVQKVRDDIAAAVAAMEATTRDVSNASEIAREATHALDAMVGGITLISQHSSDVAALARTQAYLASNVAGAFESFDASAGHAANAARSAADNAAAQQASLEELSRSAAQLSATAGRLRALVLRRQATQELSLPATANASRDSAQGVGERRVA